MEADIFAASEKRTCLGDWRFFWARSGAIGLLGELGGASLVGKEEVAEVEDYGGMRPLQRGNPYFARRNRHFWLPMTSFGTCIIMQFFRLKIRKLHYSAVFPGTSEISNYRRNVGVVVDLE